MVYSGFVERYRPKTSQQSGQSHFTPQTNNQKQLHCERGLRTDEMLQSSEMTGRLESHEVGKSALPKGGRAGSDSDFPGDDQLR